MIVLYDTKNRTFKLDSEGEEFSLAENLNEFEELCDKEDTTIVLKDMPVYNTGWNRRYVAIDPEVLETYAEKADNEFALLDHDSEKIIGRTSESRVEEKAFGRKVLLQDIVVNTQLGREYVRAGANLRASIAFQRLEDCFQKCSICKNEWLQEDCNHWIGDKDENGAPWMLLVDKVIHRETSLTSHPACTGTGSDAYSGDVPVDLVQAGFSKMRDRLSDVEKNLQTVNDVLAEVEEERAKILKEKQEVQRQDALKIVRELRKVKGLSTPAGLGPLEFEDKLADLYLNHREQYDLMYSSVPNSTVAVVQSDSGESNYKFEDVIAKITATHGSSKFFSQQAEAAREVAAFEDVTIREALMKVKAHFKE